MFYEIKAKEAPAIGDVRQAHTGDTIRIHRGANLRKDFPRYMDAIQVAVSRGADVRWIR